MVEARAGDRISPRIWNLSVKTGLYSREKGVMERDGVLESLSS
jgi:hypothetical protein